ncbi:restriction endonuclease subunit S [Bradyrhizobium sp. RDT10]
MDRGPVFADVIGGGTPSNAADPANFDADGVPWITPADLSGYSGSAIRKGSRSLSPTGLQRSSTQMLPAGSVLISSRAPVGYCVIAEVPVCTNQGFKNLRLKASIDPYFIRYFVLYAKRRLNDAASGTTFKELSGRAMGQILFPLAPLAEQRRIVVRIDALLAEIAEGEAALAEARKGSTSSAARC